MTEMHIRSHLTCTTHPSCSARTLCWVCLSFEMHDAPKHSHHLLFSYFIHFPFLKKERERMNPSYLLDRLHWGKLYAIDRALYLKWNLSFIFIKCLSQEPIFPFVVATFLYLNLYKENRWFQCNSYTFVNFFYELVSIFLFVLCLNWCVTVVVVHTLWTSIYD